MKNIVDFCLEDHTYKVDGQPVYCFSEIMDIVTKSRCRECEGHGCQACNFSGRRSWYTEESSGIGTWIHERCQAIAAGEDDAAFWNWFDEQDDDFFIEKTKIQSFKRFLLDQNLYGQPHVIEPHLFSDTLNVAGTPDVLFPIQKIGIEIKSGKKERWHWYQPAVYDRVVTDSVKNSFLSEFDLKPGPWRWILVYVGEKYKAEMKPPHSFRELVNKFKSFHVTYAEWKKLTGEKNER